MSLCRISFVCVCGGGGGGGGEGAFVAICAPPLKKNICSPLKLTIHCYISVNA